MAFNRKSVCSCPAQAGVSILDVYNIHPINTWMPWRWHPYKNVLSIFIEIPERVKLPENTGSKHPGKLKAGEKNAPS